MSSSLIVNLVDETLPVSTKALLVIVPELVRGSELGGIVANRQGRIGPCIRHTAKGGEALVVQFAKWNFEMADELLFRQRCVLTRHVTTWPCLAQMVFHQGGGGYREGGELTAQIST